VLTAIEIGGLGTGTMPAGIIEGDQAQAVADFIAQNAGQ
jgi:hypothetical protein